ATLAQGSGDEARLSSYGRQRRRALLTEASPRRRDDAGCDELEEGEAPERLRGLRHRIQGARRRQVLRIEEPPLVRRRRQGSSVDDALADPEVPMGALPAQRRASR